MNAIFLLVLLIPLSCDGGTFSGPDFVDGDAEYEKEWDSEVTLDGDIDGDLDEDYVDISELDKQENDILDGDVNEGDSETWVTSDGIVSEFDPFHVFFTNVYDGDRTVAQNDPKNSDKQLNALIAFAKTKIHCSFYDLRLYSAADALIAAHNKGVEVQIVTDSDHMDREAMMRVINAGIPVVEDNHDAIMHNKFMIVDDEIVWTGSMNVTDTGAWNNNNNSIMIYSAELAANYEAEFEEQFVDRNFHKESPYSVAKTFDINGMQVENYFAPEENTMDRLIELINNAKESIHFLAFAYTDDDLAIAMINAHERGVEVTGVFEKRSANDQYSEFERLDESEVMVKVDSNSSAMHHKYVVIDRKIVWTGSFNFSWSANNKNDENVLILHSDWLAQPYEEEFDRIWSTSVAN